MALSAPRPGFRSGRTALLLWRLAAGAALVVTLNGWACIPSAADEKVNEGNAYFEKGDYRKARTRYHQAIALDPANAKAYYALGVIAYTQGSYGSAVINFRRAIGLNSREADFWFYLGNSYAQMGKYQEAVDAYEQVVALERLYPDIYYARGVAHYNLRQWDYALRDFESYLRYSPDGDRRATAYQLIDSLKKGGVKPAEEQAPAAGP
jgi:tetratricopeptide (TPR) repeat protein